MKRHGCAMAFGVVAAATVPAAAQTVPTIVLERATAAASEAFSEITDVVELADGRIIVSDERESRIVLMDLAAGTSRTIGRQGSGPGEYRGISTLLPRPGGAYLVDGLLRRLLPINPDGAFASPIAYPGRILVRGIDARGVLYGETFTPRTADRMVGDSMWVLRWDVNASQFDTLMKYAGGAATWIRPAGAPLPTFPNVDTWAALPNGDVLVLGAAEYRATVWRDGHAARSAIVPFTRIRFTSADRDEFLRSQANQPVRRLGRGGSGAVSPPVRGEFEFPDTYPPFGGDGLGGRYAIVAPNGQVWIKRLRSAGDSVPVYDVLAGASGTLLARVNLPVRTRLAGFGPSGVYIAALDADDLAYLRRHPYPPLLGR